MKHAVQALELDTQQFKTPEILATTLGLPQDEMNANGPESLDQKLNFDDSDSDAQPLNHGREVLGDLDTLRRDEVDSYVLAIKRRLRHRHGLKRDSCVSKLRKENCLRAKSVCRHSLFTLIKMLTHCFDCRRQPCPRPKIVAIV